MGISNAVVTALSGPGVPDRSGDVTAAGPDAWMGRCPAYLSRVRSRVVTKDQAPGSDGQRVQLATVYEDTLVIQRPPSPLLAAVPGDDSGGWTVVVEDRRSPTVVTKRFRVVLVDHRAMGGPADSLKLGLDDEQAV